MTKAEYDKAWWAANKHKRAEYNRRAYAKNPKNHLGLPEGSYEELLIAQYHKCAICGRPAEACRQRLHIDHDHSTLEVRGLLCENCNRGLGLFNDNPEALRNAAEYLGRNGTGIFIKITNKLRAKWKLACNTQDIVVY